MLFGLKSDSFPYFLEFEDKKFIIGHSGPRKTYIFLKSLKLSYLFETFYEHYYEILQKIVFQEFAQLMDSGS